MKSATRYLVGALRWVARVPTSLAIGTVRLYQLLLSPLLGRNCRFTPTCSQYYIEAVRKYGLLRGTLKGVSRVCRCHPFHPGGFDPP